MKTKTEMIMIFDNKIALVTGGSRGIGKQIAIDLSKRGAKVYIVSTKTPDWQLPNISYICADLNGDMTDLNVFLRRNEIDILINNAGINIIKPLYKVTNEDYDRIHNINLKSPYMIIKESNITKGGKVVNISSIWSVKTKAERSLYTTMKTGLVGMTKTLSVELAQHNILVNSVSPGFTNTELTDQSLSKEEKDSLSSQVPLGRFAETNEISNLVMFLCSDLNTYITGQNIVIDGGFTNI